MTLSHRYSMLACLVATLSAEPASAAQYFLEPELDVSAETHTNRDLATSDERASEGYVAVLGATLGIVTPTSQSNLRPQVRFQDYPDEPEAKELEGGLDFNTRYSSPRTAFDLFGSARRQDVYNAELADPRFNEFNPDRPSSSETGRIDGAGETRDSLRVNPDLRLLLTERFSLGFEADYQNVDYSSDALVGRFDYDYARVAVRPRWEATERADVFILGHAAQYREADDAHQADSVGVSLGFAYRWNESMRAELAILGERTEIDDQQPARFEDTVDTVGGEFALVHTTPVTETRLSLGRFVEPTGGGGLFASDHLQLQWDRRLSERLTLRTAALYYRDRALSLDIFNDVDAANAEVMLRWNMTRTWYLSGGYRYYWREFDQSTLGAENHAGFIGLGYRGLRSR